MLKPHTFDQVPGFFNPRQACGYRPQTIADALGRAGHDAVEDIRVFLPEAVDVLPGDLPDGGTLAGESAGGMGQLVQQGTFADQGPVAQSGDMPGAAVLAPGNGDFPFHHHPRPLARGGFVKQPGFRFVALHGPPGQKSLHVFIRYSHAVGRFFDKSFAIDWAHVFSPLWVLLFVA